MALGAYLGNTRTITDATLLSAPLLPPCCLHPPSLQPGVALGAYLGNTRTITDAMLTHAAEMLPTLISDEDLEKGKKCSLIVLLLPVRPSSLRLGAMSVDPHKR